MVGSEILELLSEADSFKMFKNDLPGMVHHFRMLKFEDCEQVTEPKVKDVLYVIIEGAVAVLDDQKVLKRANHEIKKTRRKRKKAQEKRAQEIADGTADPEEASPDAAGATEVKKD